MIETFTSTFVSDCDVPFWGVGVVKFICGSVASDLIVIVLCSVELEFEEVSVANAW